MLIKFRVRANHGFHDGNVFPRRLRPMEVVEVDEATYQKMRQSDPESIELLQRLVPNPVKAKPKGKETPPEATQDVD